MRRDSAMDDVVGWRTTWVERSSGSIRCLREAGSHGLVRLVYVFAVEFMYEYLGVL